MSESDADRDSRIIMKYGANSNWFFWPKSIDHGQNPVYDITGAQ